MKFKALLYLFLIPLYPIEWLVVLIFNVWEVLTNSIRELILVLENYVNAPTKSNLPADKATANKTH